MAYSQASTSTEHRQPPLVAELQQIFALLPDTAILKVVGGRLRRGPKGYPVQTLFRTLIASYYLNTASIADMVRILEDNPHLAEVCGFDYPDVPSRSTLSRFFAKISRHQDALDDCLAGLTKKLREYYPDLGTTIAIDSTDIRSWSNAHNKRQPEADQTSDPEAGWTVKRNVAARGQKQFTWGYKLQLVVDADMEVPLCCFVTRGNATDFHAFVPAIGLLADLYFDLQPKYVLADAGYDAGYNYLACLNIGAIPFIRGRRSQGAKKTGWEVRPYSQDVIDLGDKAQEIYNRRTAVERVLSRLKQTKRLREHRFRGLAKVSTHCLLAVIAFQARVVLQASLNAPLRECLRKVA